jgi:hypothetical protein
MEDFMASKKKPIKKAIISSNPVGMNSFGNEKKELFEKLPENKKEGLCFRCEERAKFLETGHGSRCECGDIQVAVCSCYCYSPVKPVVMAVNKGDKRPQFAGWMFSSRSHFVRIPELDLELKKFKDGSMIYWKPKT